MPVGFRVRLREAVHEFLGVRFDLGWGSRLHVGTDLGVVLAEELESVQELGVLVSGPEFGFLSSLTE